MLKIIAASFVGAVLAGGLSLAGTTMVSSASATSEPVNESLYNYGDR